MSSQSQAILVIAGLGVAGVIGWMLITGKGWKGLLEDSIGGIFGGIGGALKDAWFSVDPDNKVGKFVTDLQNDSYARDEGTPFLLDRCPKHWVNDGLTCRNPVHTQNGKVVGGEVVGRLNNKSCGSKERSGGLCYRPCADGYHGVGPVCWANKFGIQPKDKKKDPLKAANTQYAAIKPATS